MQVKRVLSHRGTYRASIVIFFSIGTLLTYYDLLPTTIRLPSYVPGWITMTNRRDRILCAIITTPANHGSKARAVRDTWAKRCDLAIFFTTKKDPAVFTNHSSVVLNVSEGRAFLWAKTRTAFLFIYEHYGDQFEWFLKADDDTYFIMDNLRSFLFGYDPIDPIWLGCRLVEPSTKLEFPSGGAGYVLSRGALNAFAETVQSNENRTNSDSNQRRNTSVMSGPGCDLTHSDHGEDVRFTLCLKRAGVRLLDTQGSDGAYRFLPTMLEHFVIPDRNGGNGWVWNYGGKPKQGIDSCCHKRLISIHYTPPKLMYVFEFLIYHLKVTGIR